MNKNFVLFLTGQGSSVIYFYYAVSIYGMKLCVSTFFWNVKCSSVEGVLKQDYYPTRPVIEVHITTWFRLKNLHLYPCCDQMEY